MPLDCSTATSVSEPSRCMTNDDPGGAERLLPALPVAQDPLLHRDEILRAAEIRHIDAWRRCRRRRRRQAAKRHLAARRRVGIGLALLHLGARRRGGARRRLARRLLHGRRAASSCGGAFVGSTISGRGRRSAVAPARARGRRRHLLRRPGRSRPGGRRSAGPTNRPGSPSSPALPRRGCGCPSRRPAAGTPRRPAPAWPSDRRADHRRRRRRRRAGPRAPG